MAHTSHLFFDAILKKKLILKPMEEISQFYAFVSVNKIIVMITLSLLSGISFIHVVLSDLLIYS